MQTRNGSQIHRRRNALRLHGRHRHAAQTQG
jgi:hypothetical protein